MKTALFALLGPCLLALASAGCYRPCSSSSSGTYPQAKEPVTFYQMPRSMRAAIPPPSPMAEHYDIYYSAPYFGPYVYRPYIHVPRYGSYVYHQNYVHFGYGHPGSHFSGFHGGHGHGHGH